MISPRAIIVYYSRVFSCARGCVNPILRGGEGLKEISSTDGATCDKYYFLLV